MSTPWQRPSTCTAGGCIEVRAVGGRIVIRDSARPAEQAWCRPADFTALVAAAKAGEYDHLTSPTEETDRG